MCDVCSEKPLKLVCVCKCQVCGKELIYLNVSNIIVKSTNFPSKGTTSDVGGIISASKRKNTVNDSKMLMERETWKRNKIKIINIIINISMVLYYSYIKLKMQCLEKFCSKKFGVLWHCMYFHRSFWIFMEIFIMLLRISTY